MNASIFANIVKGENDFTQLLCNLSSYSVVRQVIKEMVEDATGLAIGDLASSDFAAQYYTPDCGVPDLVVENESSFIVFEHKVDNTPLSPNQPNGYFRLLRKDPRPSRALIFILPRGYVYEEVLVNGVRELKGGADSPPVAVLHWPELVDRLADHGVSETSDLLREFLSLMRDWFIVEAVRFTEMETTRMYNGQTITELMKLWDVVAAVETKLGQTETIALRRSKSSYEFSIYLKDPQSREVGYFGIWYEVWLETGIPLCFAVSETADSKLLSRFRTTFPNHTKQAGWLVHGLDQSYIEGDSYDVDRIVELIVNVMTEAA